MEDKVIINCDWLQYSVMLEDDFPEFICPDRYRIEVLQGNNIFRNRAIVWDTKGRKWLTLLWAPFSSLLNKRLMTVQVSNELLYYNAITMSYNLLRQIVDCHFNSCGRVDICADFQVTNAHLTMMKHLNSGHYYVQGKGEGSTWWHKIQECSNDRVYKKNQTHCLSWGSKDSDIKVKMYNKSRELGVLSKKKEYEKPYIISLWEQENFDITKVWRLEFSITGTGKLRWNKNTIKLEHVASSDWIRHVFYSLYNTRFVVRENQGKRKGHKNKDRQIKFLNLPKEDKILERCLGINDKPAASEAVKLLRKMMSAISSPLVMADSELCQTYCDAVARLCETHHLRSYFSAHFGDDVIPYLQRVIDESGEGIFEVDGNPNKTWQ